MNNLTLPLVVVVQAPGKGRPVVQQFCFGPCHFYFNNQRSEDIMCTWLLSFFFSRNCTIPNVINHQWNIDQWISNAIQGLLGEWCKKVALFFFSLFLSSWALCSTVFNIDYLQKWPSMNEKTVKTFNQGLKMLYQHGCKQVEFVETIQHLYYSVFIRCPVEFNQVKGIKVR